MCLLFLIDFHSNSLLFILRYTNSAKHHIFAPVCFNNYDPLTGILFINTQSGKYLAMKEITSGAVSQTLNGIERATIENAYGCFSLLLSRCRVDMTSDT